MKRSILLLIVMSAAAFADGSANTEAKKEEGSWDRPPEYPQVHFVQGGQKTRLLVPFNRILRKTGDGVLRAYGRVWTKPVAYREHTMGRRITPMEFDIPDIRRPTVFSLTNTARKSETVGHVVAYPKAYLKNPKTIRFATQSRWFYRWTQAIGWNEPHALGFNKLDMDALSKSEPGTIAGLLVLDNADWPRLYRMLPETQWTDRWNILLMPYPKLEWVGNRPLQQIKRLRKELANSGPVVVSPGQFRAGLSEIAKQKWAKPLTFIYRVSSAKIIANRRPWVVDQEGLPLVEQIALGEGRSVFVNYLPWQYAVGHSETSDATFVAMLAAMAKNESALPNPSQRPRYAFRTSLPSGETVEKTKRPVLSTVSFGLRLGESIAFYPYITALDLRGKSAPDALKTTLARISKDATGPEKPSRFYVILGDDPALQAWPWLQQLRKNIARDNKTVDKQKNDLILLKQLRRSGVYWIDDDTLPSRWNSQVKLMQVLTELGVPIKTTLVTEGKK
jgi:hypothetical protein